MKRIFLLLLVASSMLTACDKDDCNPATNRASFAANKQIVVLHHDDMPGTHYQVQNGENLVFEYNHSGAQCEDRIDDEWGYVLAFEVDKDATQFRFEGAELAAANAFYREYGAWVGAGTHALESGVIEGSRISGSRWRVKVSVIAPPLSQSSHLKQITFDTVFEQ